jgi:hypothetical protein
VSIAGFVNCVRHGLTGVLSAESLLMIELRKREEKEIMRAVATVVAMMKIEAGRLL